jgi:hypothetical protein
MSPFEGLPRELTKGDWIYLTVRTPNGEVQSSGGRYDGMSISENGLICIDYMIDDEEGFALSDYLGYITKIELSTEEFLNGPPPDDAGG